MAACAAAEGGRGRVLVVDDEMHLRLFLKAVYESAGYEVATARDGEEGLRRLRELRPRLVSLDMMMPNQGGVRFLSELRADPELKETRVLVVSAVESGAFRHALDLLRAAGPLAGPDGYVEKPPTPERVLAEADRILSEGAGTGLDSPQHAENTRR